MRKWARTARSDLTRRQFAAQDSHPASAPSDRPLARWALLAVVIVVMLAAAFSGWHALSGRLARLSSAIPHIPAVGQGVAASAFSPLVSRGKPVYCSPDVYNAGGQDSITSGKYGDWSFWQAGVNKLPSWCSVHIGSGPKRLLVAWTSDFIFDYISPNGMTPRDYTLAVSGDSSDGADGHWRTVVTVTNNQTRVREALVPFAGMSWVKMTVTRGQAQPSQPFIRIDQIDCYDVSANLNDTALFQGDSITVLAYLRADGTHPTFDELTHRADSRLFPTMLNEGIGYWESSAAVEHIQTWLALNPDIHYWFLEWGTNDALNMVSPSVYHDNMQILIRAIKAAGHTPVLAHIPAIKRAGAQGAALDAEIRALNAQLDLLTRDNHLIPGPDLYTLTSQHLTTYLGPDGIHPTTAGAAAMNNAWYLAMRDTLKASVG